MAILWHLLSYTVLEEVCTCCNQSPRKSNLTPFWLSVYVTNIYMNENCKFIKLCHHLTLLRFFFGMHITMMDPHVVQWWNPCGTMRDSVVQWGNPCGTMSETLWYNEGTPVVQWGNPYGTMTGPVVKWGNPCGTMRESLWYNERTPMVQWGNPCGTMREPLWYNKGPCGTMREPL